MRPSNRAPDELRKVTFERGVARYAEGSCLVRFGETHVLCAASLEDKPPPWLRGQGRGWVTAEYAMLPRATTTRTRRESTTGKVSGRTQEIQRLIGRSLRAVVDLPRLGERQITLDCDVLQADGGTRTAAITGAWIALNDCLKWMTQRSILRDNPMRDHVAAISCGIVKGEAVLDLDYAEDSTAETDANFVMTGSGGLVEVQGTAEGAPFSEAQLLEAAGAGARRRHAIGGDAEERDRGVERRRWERGRPGRSGRDARDPGLGALPLHPGPQNMMRDRHRMGRLQLARMAPLQHGRRLVAREPARVFEFDAIDMQFARRRLGDAADHQRGRERPGLRGEIGDLAAADSRLLEDFAAHRILDRLARFEKAGEARIHRLGEARLAPEQAIVAIDRQHDDDRIGARKMLRLADVAFAPPARRRDARHRAAIGAMAVAHMPIHQRLGLAEHADQIGRQQALHRDRAHVDQREIVAAGHGHHPPVEKAVAGIGTQFDRPVFQQKCEDRRAAGQQAEQRGLARRAETIGFAQGKERIEAFGALSHDRRVAAEDQRARVGPGALGGQKRLVLALFRDPVERIDREAEAETTRAAI